MVHRIDKSIKAFISGIREKSTFIFPFLFLPLLLINHISSAQKLATTQDGDIVILFDDGSWKFAPTDQIDNSRYHGCRYEIDQRKSDSTQKMSVLKKETFISHRYEKMKNTSNYNDYVHCDLAIGEVGENKIVYLDYILQTKYGLYNHGIIQEGKKLLIKLKNNSTVTLTLDRTDKGEVNEQDNETIYHTFAYITPKIEKELKKSEVNEVLMPWSMGNEIYDVTYPRIFIDQLFCFD